MRFPINIICTYWWIADNLSPFPTWSILHLFRHALDDASTSFPCTKLSHMLLLTCSIRKEQNDTKPNSCTVGICVTDLSEEDCTLLQHRAGIELNSTDSLCLHYQEVLLDRNVSLQRPNVAHTRVHSKQMKKSFVFFDKWDYVGTCWEILEVMSGRLKAVFLMHFMDEPPETTEIEVEGTAESQMNLGKRKLFYKSSKFEIYRGHTSGEFEPWKWHLSKCGIWS